MSNSKHGPAVALNSFGTPTRESQIKYKTAAQQEREQFKIDEEERRKKGKTLRNVGLPLNPLMWFNE